MLWYFSGSSEWRIILHKDRSLYTDIGYSSKMKRRIRWRRMKEAGDKPAVSITEGVMSLVILPVLIYCYLFF